VTRLLSTIWRSVTETPPVLWVLVLVIAMLAGGVGGAAVTHTLYASLYVPTSGTITDSNAATSACVGTNGSKQYAYNSNCVNSVAETSPIGNSGTATNPNFTCTGCLTTAGGQTISAQDTAAGFALTAEDLFQGDSATCSSAPTTVYGACFGSGAGTTNNIAIAIGKQSGGWGGSTSSDSAKLCFFENNGTSDRGGGIYYSSALGNYLYIGDACGETGPSGLKINLNTIHSGWIESTSNASAEAYDPPTYTSSGGSAGSSTHAVVGTTSCTTNSSAPYHCAVSVTLSNAAAFTSQSSYGCSASGYSANFQQSETISVENSSGTSFTLNVNNDGATTETVTFYYFCLGT